MNKHKSNSNHKTTIEIYDVDLNSENSTGAIRKTVYVATFTKSNYDHNYHKSIPEEVVINKSVTVKPLPTFISAANLKLSQTNEIFSNNEFKKLKQFQCATCKEWCLTSVALKSHIRKFHKPPTNCSICNKSFKTRYHLKDHLFLHTGEKPYKCILCFRSFATKGYLSNHKSSHFNIKRHNCPLCNKAYKKKSHLKNHMFIHSSHRSFECYMCKKTYYYLNILQNHVNNVHSYNSFKCYVCGMITHSSNILKSHMKLHTGIKSYKCIICDKAFARQDYLKKHMNSKIVHSKKY